MSADIIRGNNVALQLQIAQRLFVANSNIINNIIASSAANPAKITTQYPHGLTTGNKVLILGEQTNTTILGNHPITVVDTTNFTLNSVAGFAASTERPMLFTTFDMSAITITLRLKRFPGGPALKNGNTVIVPTTVWTGTNDRTVFLFTWTVSEADSAALPKGQVILNISYTDASGNDQSWDKEYTVGNA